MVQYREQSTVEQNTVQSSVTHVQLSSFVGLLGGGETSLASPGLRSHNFTGTFCRPTTTAPQPHHQPTTSPPSAHHKRTKMHGSSSSSTELALSEETLCNLCLLSLS